MQSQLSFINETKELKNTYATILKERIATYGTSTLTDEEILSLLTGISIEIIKPQLELHGTVDLIKNINSYNLTKAQKHKLQMLYEYSKRIKFPQSERIKINSSTLSGEYFVKDLAFHEKEVFKVLMLDTQNRIIKLEQISEGTITEAPIYTRNIIQTILNTNAAKVIFAHNHPGGSLRPSSCDIESTKKLVEACKACSVSVVDHVIVADDKYISFAEEGLL